MVKEKKDLISNSDFTQISHPLRKKHKSLPQRFPDDENENTLEETLIGMEYDLDSDEDYWAEEDEENLDEEQEEEEEHLYPGR